MLDFPAKAPLAAKAFRAHDFRRGDQGARANAAVGEGDRGLQD